MRLTGLLWLAAGAALAQTSAPSGIVRGDLLECEVVRGGGELSVRTAAHQVYRFSFDARTYFERDRERTTPEKLHPGDLLEIVSDKPNGASLSYARTVHVMERENPQRQPLSLGRYRGYRTATDHIAPLGELTFAGIVARLNGGRMVLRTRRDGEKTILLREDTRYLQDGLQVSAATLATSTQVFVRGSRNLEGQLEAYQVVWGEILEPRP